MICSEISNILMCWWN